MNIQNLVGLTLESCSFSKSSYTFEVSGKINEKYKTFFLSTSYSFSLLGDSQVDAADAFSIKVWRFLEKKIVSISVDENFPRIVFTFEGGGQYCIYSSESLIDNLLIVRDRETGGWFSVL